MERIGFERHSSKQRIAFARMDGGIQEAAVFTANRMFYCLSFVLSLKILKCMDCLIICAMLQSGRGSRERWSIWRIRISSADTRH